MTSSIILFVIIGFIASLILFRKFGKQVLSVAIGIAIALVGWTFLKTVLFTPEKQEEFAQHESLIFDSARKITNYIAGNTLSAQQLRSRVDALIASEITDQTDILMTELQNYIVTQKIPINESEIVLPNDAEFNELEVEQKITLKEQLVSLFAKEGATSTPVIINDAEPADAQVIKQGLFTNQLSTGEAQGLVSLFQTPFDTITVYIQELDIQSGPDLELYLAAVDPLNQTVDTTFFFIGPLKGRLGNQSYIVPSTLDVYKYDTAFIYSPVIDTVYAIAPLR